jgi:Ca2+-transporting ATPase
MSSPAPENPALPQLTEEEAAIRLRTDGPNALEEAGRHGFLRALFGVVRQPMFLLLIAAGLLYLALGNAADALTLLAFVVLVMALTLYQDRRSEHAVAKLRDLTAPTACVVRAGKTLRIATSQVVRGDLVLLSEGDRVPADGVVLSATNLRVDESLLTGESVPVDKLPGEVETALVAPGSDAASSVYGSTLVVSGHGVASVRATGQRSAVGAIGKALARTTQPKSPLAKEVDSLVLRLALVGVGLCALLVVAYGLSTGDYLQGLLHGITLAMAILPEEFPVVLTIFTTLGAFRIAKFGVLARRPETIESLGAAQVLCVDKTGTITENRMRVATLVPLTGDPVTVAQNGSNVLPEYAHGLLEHALLACADDSRDPMDRAIAELAQRTLTGTEHLGQGYVREQEYPLTRALLAVSHLFATGDGQRHVVAAKGAPEAIVDLCHLDAAHAARVLAQVEKLATGGLRVLAVASAAYAQTEHPVDQHAFAFSLLGLVGFEDPVRASVPAAVQAFRAAGIRVVMITGDHAATARAIAEKAGLDLEGGVMTGAELQALAPEARARAVARVNVFARATPELKLMLVQAFSARGEIVAMTGDGVNDAPALKAADIGVALGVRGTDVAREAAALVLTTEDFGAIAQAIVLGRRIFENLRRAMMYVVAVHVPIAGMAFVPILLGLPSFLFPVHVLFLEMLIDPACTVAMEAESPDPQGLLKPTRAHGEALLGKRNLLVSLLQGCVLFAGVLGASLFAVRTGVDTDAARATGFVALVVGNVTLIHVQRSSTRSTWQTLFHGKNPVALWLSLAALGVLALVLAVPALRGLFHFAVPSAAALGGAIATGVLSAVWFDVVKARRAACPRP